MKYNNQFPLSPYPVDSDMINCYLIDKNDQPIPCKPIICIDLNSRRIGYGTVPTDMPLEDISFDDIIWTDDEERRRRRIS